MSFTVTLPTRVHFADGALDDLGAHCRALGSSALLVTGRGAMRRHGVTRRSLDSMAAAGIGAAIFDEISPDPTASEVDRAVAAALAGGCDVVVGLGGGSAIDAAKAIALGMRLGPVGPLVGTTVDTVHDAVPVIAVPTTAGSGAEVTWGAIVTDETRALKCGIRGHAVFPTVALVDPGLAATMPLAVAQESAFDTLAHLVEGFVARKASPISRAFARQGLPLLAERIPQLTSGRTLDPAALRRDMAVASLLGGYSVATASTCLPHRLQQAMGSSGVRISHGRGLAALYPAWLFAASPHAKAELAEVDALLGGSGEVMATIGDLRRCLGLEARLRDHGFEQRHVPAMLDAVTGALDNDPHPSPDRTLMASLYGEAL